MKKEVVAILLAGLLCSLLVAGCSGKPTNGLDPRNPITLTMWHNFGGDMQKTMDGLIDEFNSTAGKEKGIIINVTAITSSSELQDALNMIVNGDPGAPAMPDITTSYPKTAVLFQNKGMLANLDAYFTEKELAAYVPAFIQEGRFGDDGLYVFPFAKSTEILYVNQTLFDRFATATGLTMESMQTFEGIAEAARRYYAWTDAQTPDIPGDGKQFYAADSWINLAQAGMLQQGGTLILDQNLNLDNDIYAHIWETCYAPSVAGGFAIYDGYSSDLSKTGDLVCSTGSSAGILFYGDTITYADNTVEQVEYSILPFPVFQGGKKIAIQRGNGFSVAASDPTREYAAAFFLKWFTQPAQNMRFVASTGYLPVTKEAFEKEMPAQMATVEDPRIQKMLEAVVQMQAEYEFFVAPTYAAFDSISKDYEKRYKALLQEERKAWLADDTTDPISAWSERALADFKAGR
ncbi:MAG: extracellular solute-binding protein [Clostridia bacterium]|nr:extracellular solute-binding protein [Candidatus Pelethousia sp.]NCB29807.1 extracellular solute-binding protein [Clostridia bacterium]